MPEKIESLFFSAFFDSYTNAVQSIPPEKGGLPPLDWQGWELMAEEIGLPTDNKTFRARQAAKTAMTADAVNLRGGYVDWSAVERKLEAICMGTTGLTQLPNTQEEEQMAQAAPAIILFEEVKKRKKKGNTINYMVVFDGQSEEEGEWFSSNKLKKQFPNWEEMVASYKQRIVSGNTSGAAAAAEGRAQEVAAAARNTDSNVPVDINGNANYVNNGAALPQQQQMVAQPAGPAAAPQYMQETGPPANYLAGIRTLPGPLPVPASVPSGSMYRNTGTKASPPRRHYPPHRATAMHQPSPQGMHYPTAAGAGTYGGGVIPQGYGHHAVPAMGMMQQIQMQQPGVNPPVPIHHTSMMTSPNIPGGYHTIQPVIQPPSMAFGRSFGLTAAAPLAGVSTGAGAARWNSTNTAAARRGLPPVVGMKKVHPLIQTNVQYAYQHPQTGGMPKAEPVALAQPQQRAVPHQQRPMLLPMAPQSLIQQLRGNQGQGNGTTNMPPPPPMVPAGQQQQQPGGGPSIQINSTQVQQVQEPEGGAPTVPAVDQATPNAAAQAEQQQQQQQQVEVDEGVGIQPEGGSASGKKNKKRSRAEGEDEALIVQEQQPTETEEKDRDASEGQGHVNKKQKVAKPSEGDAAAASEEEEEEAEQVELEVPRRTTRRGAAAAAAAGFLPATQAQDVLEVQNFAIKQERDQKQNQSKEPEVPARATRASTRTAAAEQAQVEEEKVEVVVEMNEEELLRIAKEKREKLNKKWDKIWKAMSEDEQEEELERRLQPDAWATAQIIRAKRGKDKTMILELEWEDGLKIKSLSSCLNNMERPHCMSSLIHYYEDRAKTQAEKEEIRK